MIDLAAPVRTVAGVTVFADHADPALFHYVPVSPRLVTDAQGRQEIRLLKYHLDPATQNTTGAALFLLTVDLAVSDDVLTQVKGALTTALGRSELTLAPIWADSGTCRLILLDSGPDAALPATPAQPATPTPPATPAAAPAVPTLVERVIGGGDPDLAANATTMFACTLDPDGAGIVEQALRQGGLPFGVVYDLQTSGLRPALHATISADYAATYHYFENRLHGGRLLLATDIGAAMQDLVQQQAIRVTLDDLVPDADKDGVYQRALDQVQQYILDTLFTPTISQSPPQADTTHTGAAIVGSLIGLFTVTYSLITVDSTELKSMTYTLDVAQAEEITLAPQGALTALLAPGTPVDGFIVAVDAAPPDQLEVDVASLVDLAAEGIDHVDVTLSYAGRTTPLTLNPSTPRVVQAVTYEADAGLETAYNYAIQLAANGPKGLSGRLESSTPATSVHDIIRVDPRALYHRVELRPALLGVPAHRFSQVILDVEAHEALDDWTVTDTVTLDAATPETALAYRGRPDGLITLRTRARYVRSTGEELTAGWRDTEPGPLVLGDPEPAVVTVQVLASARFGTVVARLVVELRADAAPDTVGTLSLDATTTAGTWSYVPSPTARGYSYRVTVQSIAGTVTAGDWLPGPADPNLVVGEGFRQLRTVRVVFVGTTLAAAKLLAAKIRLTFGDAAANLNQDDEFLAQDPLAPITWPYPVADPSREDYTMTITWIHADGSSTTDAPRTGSDLVQVVPILAVP